MNIRQFLILLLRLHLRLLNPKWTYGEALRKMWRLGKYNAFYHLLNWVNKKGGKGGWDGNFRKAFPSEAKLLWP
ncbi:hypothetical protein ACTNDP_23155 [Paenibacillus barengoltzii]|uniref:hypothetical protein n=1 Tax=Paenibacillus barengoltzii TaxID=343517 RepID=UPI003F8CA5A9